VVSVTAHGASFSPELKAKNLFDFATVPPNLGRWK